MKNFIICWTLLVVTTTSVLAGPKGKTTTGHQLQADFCKLLERGKSKPVMDMFAPSLRAEVDAPVMQRWLEQMQVNLGRVRTIRQRSVDSTMHGGDHRLSPPLQSSSDRSSLAPLRQFAPPSEKER